MSNVPQKLPELKMLDPKAETEIYQSFKRVYEYIDSVIRTKLNEIETKIKAGTVAPEDFNNLIGVLSQPLVGSSITDPLLQSIIQSFGPQNANHVFAGPSPSFRSLVAADIPNISGAKITSGTIPLARLDNKIIETDDGLSKTLGAPIADGYIIIKDNAGNSVKVITTA